MFSSDKVTLTSGLIASYIHGARLWKLHDAAGIAGYLWARPKGGYNYQLCGEQGTHYVASIDLARAVIAASQADAGVRW